MTKITYFYKEDLKDSKVHFHFLKGKKVFTLEEVAAAMIFFQRHKPVILPPRKSAYR